MAALLRLQLLVHGFSWGVGIAWARSEPASAFLHPHGSNRNYPISPLFNSALRRVEDTVQRTPDHSNIAYKHVGGVPLELDVHLPRTGGNAAAPAILYIHPGAWMYGSKLRRTLSSMAERWSDKADLNEQVLRALDHGFAIIAVNYRLTTQGAMFPGSNVTWPAQGNDIADAMTWARAHGEEYGVDPSRIACWGESAGGHLCAWLAAAGGVNLDIRPNVAVDFCGPTCFLCTHNVTWLGHSPADWLFGFEPGTLAELKRHELDVNMDNTTKAKINLVRSAEPLAWVNNRTAPIFIGHGTADSTVPVFKAELLAGRLEQAGTPYYLQEVYQGGHMYSGWPDRVAEDAIEFIEKHMDADAEGSTMLDAAGAGIQMVGAGGRHGPRRKLAMTSYSDVEVNDMTRALIKMSPSTPLQSMG